MRRNIVTVPLLLLLSTYAAGQATGGGSKSTGSAIDEAAIRKVLADFVEGWNKHDARAFSMVFAEDADFTNVRGVSAHGRAEVEKFHAPLFATRFRDTNQKMTKTKVRFIKPDVAAVDAWWEMTGAKGAEGQDIPLRKGLLNFVMTREGAKWFITVMHNMDLPASP
ncbi:MAG: SgcJ/EcaC family oxidoreductase [Pyrinomonadaceae bacterium]